MALESLKKKNLNPTVKDGRGSVLVWACMSSSGVGNIEFIDGIMDNNVYLDILKRNVKESARKLGIRKHFLFQQDPRHTSNVCYDYLQKEGIRRLEWLPKVRI